MCGGCCVLSCQQRENRDVFFCFYLSWRLVVEGGRLLCFLRLSSNMVLLVVSTMLLGCFFWRYCFLKITTDQPCRAVSMAAVLLFLSQGLA